jgi:hypothetical protein
MTSAIPLAAGAALLFVLLLLAAQGVLAARGFSSRSEVPFHEDGFDLPPCPTEFVSKIFSRSDWEFVAGTDSPKLQQLFREERKAVALLWVRQTSAFIQKVMREHKEAARASSDLQIATETKLLFLYSQLMLVCGALLLAIQVAGPLWLRGVAVYADSLSRRIAGLQDSLTAATAGSAVHTAGPS